MKRHTRLYSPVAAALCMLMIGLSGCKTPKNVAYFQDVTETVYPTVERKLNMIEPNDRLSIIVKTKDPGISTLFNKTLPYDRVGEGYSDYIVSPKGDIDFPILGEIKVEGMNRNELATYIKEQLISKGYTKDAVVTVDILNLGFAVMGEVNKAGYYGLIKDGMNILEALSTAGDLTINGLRENVKVIRQTPEGNQTYTVDLTNFSELSKSPAYYVKQGDVIYVEPNNLRKRETTSNGNNVLNAGFWVSVASLAASVAVLLIKK